MFKHVLYQNRGNTIIPTAHQQNTKKKISLKVTVMEIMCVYLIRAFKGPVKFYIVLKTSQILTSFVTAVSFNSLRKG